MRLAALALLVALAACAAEVLEPDGDPCERMHVEPADAGAEGAAP